MAAALWVSLALPAAAQTCAPSPVFSAGQTLTAAQLNAAYAFCQGYSSALTTLAGAGTTGTGAVVRATGPTLSTPVFSTGVAIANAGLTVNNVSLVSNNGILVPNGSFIGSLGWGVTRFIADGIVQWDNNAETLKTKRVTGAMTVAALAAALTCNSGNDGAEGYVTDANSSTFLAALVGGGSVHTRVHCDGSGTPAWKVG